MASDAQRPGVRGPTPQHVAKMFRADLAAARKAWIAAAPMA
jgi:hypothetical protein